MAPPCPIRSSSRTRSSRRSLFECPLITTVAPVTLAQQMDKVEKALIEQALRNCQGRVPKVMETLGIAKKTLYDKLHRHDIDVDRYR